MTISVTPTQSQVFEALRGFLLAVLPSGTPVVKGQDNRVPEPAAGDYVLMTPLRRNRIETNIDEWGDVKFIGSIAVDTLTITTMDSGAVKVGSVVYGTNVAANTTITQFVSGSGGVGTYKVTPQPQTVASTVMSAGVQNMLQPVQLTVQLDVHGPSSGNNAQRISTLLRDEYGTDFFAGTPITGGVIPDVTPLYASDPLQLPFINGENQYEERWVVEATLQVNEVVTDVPQQFMDTAVIGLINVDATYPP